MDKPDGIPAPAGAESDAAFESRVQRVINGEVGCAGGTDTRVVPTYWLMRLLARRASTASSEEDVERVEQAIRENIRPDRDIKDAARAALAAVSHRGYRAGWPADSWTVERIDEDGGIEQAFFVGPDADKRAHRYASSIGGTCLPCRAEADAQPALADASSRQPEEPSRVSARADEITRSVVERRARLRKATGAGDDRGSAPAPQQWLRCTPYDGSVWVCPNCDCSTPCEVKAEGNDIRCGRCKTEFGPARFGVKVLYPPALLTHAELKIGAAAMLEHLDWHDDEETRKQAYEALRAALAATARKGAAP